MNIDKLCPICQGASSIIGAKEGVRIKKTFNFLRCDSCKFTFVGNPHTKYTEIYDECYYQGKGSDPGVNYAQEFENPNTTSRIIEWEGIRQLANQQAGEQWLDFGCGHGGLVRYITNLDGQIEGMDTGAWAEKAKQSGINIVTEEEIEKTGKKYDIITAIEVIEHIVLPVEALITMRKLLKPGGRLIITTGNADAAPKQFTNWGYVNGDVHVSYFTPATLTRAFEIAGFKAINHNNQKAWTKIIEWKILKKLKIHTKYAWLGLLPWSIISHVVDRKHKASYFPIGIAK